MSDPTALRIVLDTNVLVAAARSRHGASFALVSSIPAPEFEPCLSLGLYAEWQEVLARPEHLPPGLAPQDALGFVRYLASQCHLQEIHFCGGHFCPMPMTIWCWNLRWPPAVSI